jgi:divinyl chlorophyllide a 8-vinyl-reductase
MSDTSAINDTKSDLRVLVLGGTGTAGSATVRALQRAGYTVTCLVRTSEPESSLELIRQRAAIPGSVNVHACNVTEPLSLRNKGFKTGKYDVLVSCLASRTGASDDAWLIDYQTHSQALALAKEFGVAQFILLSALCVQKPLLDFQHAKRKFEKELIGSDLTYSIVRPTAFFKSLSGQVERVRRGKPFLVFGDGKLTSCKPISDDDLGDYITSCIVDTDKHNKILPIGGPGPAITPLEQGEYLFRAMQKEPQFRHVPINVLDGTIRLLRLFGRFNKTCSAKAELASIGRYYATESMLVLNQATGQYDEDNTPSFGADTLQAYYDKLINGSETVKLNEHTVFD